MTPRVLIDGLALTDGNRRRGIGAYVRGLLAELAKRDDVNVSVLTTEPALVPAGLQAVRMVRLAPPRFRVREHNLLLPLDARRVQTDVFHSPALAPPAGPRARLVMTLHDLVPLTQPGYEEARPVFERMARVARTAAAVITGSRHAAEESTRLLDLRPERVFVAPHGIDPSFTPGPTRPGDPYLLLVGEYEPRRNYRAAFEIAAAAALRLKVVGSIAPWVEPALRAEVARAARPDLVELLGFVPDAELVDLYRGATAVLLTSRAEGFGFPALEAMACAAPVVAFRNSSIEEVVGDGGLLVPDGDVGAAASAVARLLASPEERERLRAPAAAQVARFTWARSAQIHVEAYLAACTSD